MLLLLLMKVTCNEPKIAVTWAFSRMLALPLLARACPFASALPHVACLMYPLASPAPRLRARAPPAAQERGPFCACSRGPHIECTAGMSCCTAARCPQTVPCESCAPAPFPRRFPMPQASRNEIWPTHCCSSAAVCQLGQRSWYPGRATHMVAPDAASGWRGTCPDGSERGRVGGLAREGSRRDRGAIGAPHPCSRTS